MKYRRIGFVAQAKAPIRQTGATDWLSARRLDTGLGRISVVNGRRLPRGAGVCIVKSDSTWGRAMSLLVGCVHDLHNGGKLSEFVLIPQRSAALYHYGFSSLADSGSGSPLKFFLGTTRPAVC